MVMVFLRQDVSCMRRVAMKDTMRGVFFVVEEILENSRLVDAPAPAMSSLYRFVEMAIRKKHIILGLTNLWHGIDTRARTG